MKHWYYEPIASDSTGMISDSNSAAYKQLLDTEGAGMLDFAMASGIRDVVTVYDSDLSNPRTVECIMQHKAADTYLQSMQRRIICHPNTIHSGQYVFDGQTYWIAVGYPDNVYGIYEKCVLLICQYCVKWQNANGDIVSRWCNATTASKYDMGQVRNEYYIRSSNNFTLIFPADDETEELYNKRVFIDTHEKPWKTYRLTRDDDILLYYGNRGGCYSFIVNKEELNPEKDNMELGICDYVPQTEIPTDDRYVIAGDSSITLSVGATFTGEHWIDGELAPEVLDWQVDLGSTSAVYSIDGNTLTVVDNELDDIGYDITIKLLGDNEVKATLVVPIKSFV